MSFLAYDLVMNKLSKNQKGYTVVEGLLIILILVVIGGVGYMVYHNDHKTKAAPASTTKSGPAITWQTYSNQQAGFTYQYPSNWTNVTTIEPLLDGSFAGVYGTITAPDGSKLAWIFQYVGGKSGGCTPNAGDKAFMPGDNCASKQIISVEQLPTLKPTSNKYAKDLFENGLYITQTKYDPGTTALPPLYSGMPTYTANSTSYQICLDPNYSVANNGTPIVTSTTMRLLFPCQYWDAGFNAIFPVKGVSGFISPDAQTATKIMKSFNTL